MSWDVMRQGFLVWVADGRSIGRPSWLWCPWSSVEPATLSLLFNGLLYMLSATLTFAQTHDCDITEQMEQYVDWGNNINTHQLYLHEGSKFATPSEQYVVWDNNINFIFMRDQNSPPPLNNTLIGIITSASWGIKIRHPLWTIRWLG